MLGHAFYSIKVGALHNNTSDVEDTFNEMMAVAVLQGIVKRTDPLQLIILAIETFRALESQNTMTMKFVHSSFPGQPLLSGQIESSLFQHPATQAIESLFSIRL